MAQVLLARGHCPSSPTDFTVNCFPEVEKARNISTHPKDFVPSRGVASLEASKVSMEESLCNVSSLDSLGVEAGLDVLKRSLPT